MIDNIIKTIQKKLNTPFVYKELETICNQKLDLLMKDAIQSKIETAEYCAIIGTIKEIKEWFKVLDGPENRIVSTISVNKLYRDNLFKIKHDLT